MKKLYWGLLIFSLISTVLLIIFNVLELMMLSNIITLILILSVTTVCVLYFCFVRFKCPKCKTIFKGKFWQIFFAPHSPTKRKMPCPTCKEWLWCEDVFEKENKQ